jgi:hypothetical protein
MPTYDYRCPANGRVVEVTHSMRELMGCWGELCERAGIELGDTAYDEPVVRLATGGQILSGKAAGPSAACGPGSNELPPCMTGHSCSTGCAH